jgi:hypothetical protein
MRLIFSLALIAGIVVAICHPAQAQFSNNRTAGGTQTTGMFGATTIGGNSALNTGSSRTSSSNMGVGMGGTSSNGMTTGGAGMGATGGEILGVPQLQQSAFVGSANGGNFRSMQGQGMQGTQGMNGMQQGMNGMQGLGGTSLGGRGGIGGAGGISGLRNAFSQQGRQNSFNNQQAQRGRQGGAQGQTQIRVPIRLGFAATPVAAPQFSANLTNRLSTTPSLQRAGQINVSLEGRTAVLRGTVATEADRRLAESLARLEPEVLAVQNELVVGSAGTTGEELPPASAQ